MARESMAGSLDAGSGVEGIKNAEMGVAGAEGNVAARAAPADTVEAVETRATEDTAPRRNTRDPVRGGTEEGVVARAGVVTERLTAMC